MVEGSSSPAEIFNEPYPCDGCVHWNRCAVGKLSCKSFYIYVVERGRVDLTQRNPSRRMYYETFDYRGKAEATYERLSVMEAT